MIVAVFRYISGPMAKHEPTNFLEFGSRDSALAWMQENFGTREGLYRLIGEKCQENGTDFYFTSSRSPIPQVHVKILEFPDAKHYRKKRETK